MNGILLIDKPAGISSFGVVAKVRWIIKEATDKKIKIGHTGTLDPFATGLLILVLGSYTKRAGEFSKLDKTYEAKLILGKTSTTGDPEGEIDQKSTKKPSEEAVIAVLDTFLGDIEQKPHIYSAMKIGGQRAYKLARKGLKPEMTPRTVTIHTITDIDYAYPELAFTVSVSSGTYIRSLAEDIGEKLGTGAYLSALRRTKVGDFDINNALSLNDMTDENIQKHLQK